MREQKEKIFAYVPYNYIINFIKSLLYYMKIFTLIITFILATISIYTVDAVNYKSNISDWNPISKNTESNIEQAYLIENYIISYKTRIKNLAKKYEIKNSTILDENIEELDAMVVGLKKAQNTLVEKEDAEEIMKSVVEWLKIINNNLKPYLQNKQLNYEKKFWELIKNYNINTKKVAAQIRSIIRKVAEPMKRKTKLSTKDKEILKHLIRLEEQSKKLDAFSTRNFQTKGEIRKYLTVIVESIRRELLSIKWLL